MNVWQDRRTLAAILEADPNLVDEQLEVCIRLYFHIFSFVVLINFRMYPCACFKPNIGNTEQNGETMLETVLLTILDKKTEDAEKKLLRELALELISRGASSNVTVQSDAEAQASTLLITAIELGLDDDLLQAILSSEHGDPSKFKDIL